MIEPGLIQLTQFIAHSPAKVWQALTEPTLHAKWWAAGDVQPIVGHKFTMDIGHWGQQPCEVMEVEPEKSLTYTFAPGTLNTTITWRLEPRDGGTLLTLEHRGFDLDSPMGRSALQGMSGGWPGILKRIEPVLVEN